MSEGTLQEHPKIRRRLQNLFRDQVFSSVNHHKANDTFDNLQFLTLSIPINRIDPLACVEILRKEDQFQFYWEHPDRDFGLAGGGACGRITAHGSNRFQSIQKQIEEIRHRSLEISEIEHSQAGLHFLGGYSFDQTVNSSLWKGFREASFTIPQWLIIKDGNFGLLTITLKIGESHSDSTKLTSKFEERLEQIQPLLDFQQQHDGIIKKSEPYWSDGNEDHPIENEDLQTYNRWKSNVNRARQLIHEGVFDKIVLSRKIRVETSGDISPTKAINRLRSLYTNCYCFMIEFPASGSFIGCSPERLVQFNPRFILTDALAGSISRGTSATQDMALENRLLNSRKNRREHDYVVKAISRHLKPHTTNIQHPPNPVVKKLSNVQHLHTPILAWLKKNTSYADILKRLHPTPAVGGYPTESAMAHISNLELFERGWYASPVGWFNTKKGGEFSVAIRSGIINGTVAHFFAGCGIVQDSEAESEWEETKLKLIPMLTSVQNG